MREILLGYPQLVAFLVSFIAVGLKGFQHKNVNGNHIKAVFVTSYLMAVTDVAVIGLIAQKGFEIAFSIGTGGAFGMVLAMYVHSRTIGSEK